MWSVFFVFLSYLDRNVVKGDFLSRALDAEKESKEMFSMLNGTVCAKMSTLGDNFLYQVSDGAEVVRSVVTPAGKLVNCSVTVNHIQVKSFLQECRLGLKEQRTGWQREMRFTRMDEAKLMCRELKERTEEKDQVLKRTKRGFTYPGTLWCGAGNMAENYNQLGDFADTDSCCRTHDHCPHVIHAFSSKYGHTNFKWHSICHCDCDNALKACLRKVNDTSSRVVGQAFFNVIGVPCFDFIYEEQCAERHWYGMCKRYEKLPIAVLHESVPYDFGGIDVIDDLTVAPPKTGDSKKSNKEEKPESATQSTMSGPEEPSLGNVVTAAEDFIKVLATVSTSQSSTTESDRGEAQTSEKKKKRKKKKKITKKLKGKGKGRKRKQKAEAGVKIEEGGAVSPSGSKSEEVKALRNFISESHGQDQPSRNTNKVGDSEYELVGKDEPSNEVMKDEPAMEKEVVSITPPSTVQKSPAQSDTDVASKEISPSTSTAAAPHEGRRQRKGRRKKDKNTPLPSSEELPVNMTDNLSAVSIPTIITITPTAQPEQPSFGSDTQKRPVVSTASTPIVISKAKRNRSKEREDREGRKKRRKGSSVSPIVPVVQQNSYVDNLKVIPHTAAPTIPPIPTTELQLSHRPDVYGGKIQITPLNSSFSVLKRQRSKDRALRNRRRKIVVPPPSENRLFSHRSSENALPVLTTPDTRVALNSHASTAATVETHSEWRLFTTAAPTISTKHHRQAARQNRKPRKEAAALSNAVSILKQTESVTFTTTTFNAASAKELRSEKPFMTTSAAPAMSPLQLSIEKAKAQFSRKKRRKARLMNRQQ
uniref:phospholipase A2 n=1 Tax=Acanthochromis polyacanthus TaxID=80966 RepID=A0A3Q1EEV5_9TELE